MPLTKTLRADGTLLNINGFPWNSAQAMEEVVDNDPSAPATYAFDVTDAAYGADPTGVADATVAIRAAITAAAAAVTATGKHQVVYFPIGTYAVKTKDAFRAFDINGLSKLKFVGVPGNKSRLVMSGSAGLDDWYMFQIRASSDIEFRSLWLDMTGLTNPDPAEQNHLIQIGGSTGGVSDVRVIDCEFNYAIGDGIRLFGEFGSATKNITIQGCRFLGCQRAGVSFQRWVQNVRVLDNYFTNGTDQMVDFEPTGHTLNASGGSATTCIMATGQFITWGIEAGDVIYNNTEDVYCRVVSVDSATQLTVTAGATSWSGDAFSFPKHNSGHLIQGNQFIRGTNAGDILLTLSATYMTRVVHNYIEGSIQAIDFIASELGNNTLLTLRSDSGNTAIDMLKGHDDLNIHDNVIHLRAITATTLRTGIDVRFQDRAPHSARVHKNTIIADCRTTCIAFKGGRRCDIRGNTLILNTPGETTQSTGIFVTTINGAVTSAIVKDNEIRARGGQFLNGLFFAANALNIAEVEVGGGSIADCSSAKIRFNESAGGVFTSPPIVGATIGVGEVTPPTSLAWIAVGQGIYRGTGTPEAKLTAPVGSIACRTDGGAGTCLYAKESGTGNTGWVAR